MGRKRKATYEVEQDEKGFEALSGLCIPEWWHKADKHQLHYASSIEYADVTMVDARAGTGKTTIATMVGLKMLREGKVDVIRYVRFVDRRTQSLGFMPGKEEKEEPFFRPFYEAMAECGIQPEAVKELIAQGVIELSTDIHLRGSNMKRTFLIVDECQNGDIEDIRLVLTRLHDSGKGVAIGHSRQVDKKLRKYGKEGLIPFQVYQVHMAKKPWTKVCTLTTDYRGRISRWADEVEETIKELEKC